MCKVLGTYNFGVQLFQLCVFFIVAAKVVVSHCSLAGLLSIANMTAGGQRRSAPEEIVGDDKRMPATVVWRRECQGTKPQPQTEYRCYIRVVIVNLRLQAIPMIYSP